MNLSPLLKVGSLALRAGRLLPSARFPSLLALGGGALAVAGVGALGVALAVPETRKVLLSHASRLVERLRGDSSAPDPHEPAPLRVVDQVPRPKQHAAA